jgi:sialic acid synthase SpsE
MLPLKVEQMLANSKPIPQKHLYSKNTPDFAGYKNINKLIKDIELPREWQKDLKQYCDEKGIEFMSTPFDEKAVDELVNLGVKRLKNCRI